MKETIERELVVEILDQDEDWGRSDFIHLVSSAGRDIRILSLGNSYPPLDDPDKLWLDLKIHANSANDTIQKSYPRFLHEVAQTSGLLDITVLGNKVSLYWFMPISEMSALRNPLINKIYSLFVLRSVLSSDTYKRITLILDDPLLEKPVRQIAGEFGVEYIELLKIKRHLQYYRRASVLVVNWWRSFIYDLVYWFILRFPEIQQPSKISETILGLTIFPTLWERNEINRAFGDLPEELKRRGHGLFYLALPTMRLRDILFSSKQWRAIASSNRMTFMHSQVQLGDLFHAYMRRGWGGKIAQWVQNMKKRRYLIDGVEVSELLYREYLQEAWEPTIPQCLLLVRAAQSASKKMADLACALSAFEFQPIEKAFVLGLKMFNPQMPVIGLQTSLIGQKHLGYCFLPEQVHENNDIKSPFAPLPDYVATYGTVSYSMLKDLLGQKRVVLTGPVRYPYLRVSSDAQRKTAEVDLKKRLSLDADKIPVLMALTSLRHENYSILKWALNIGQKNPQLFFIVRFHYWEDLQSEFRDHADRIGFDRFRIDNQNLSQQLMACRLIITGTSSISVEAMISGCIPVVYQTGGKYAMSAIMDVMEGAFFFSDEHELELAVYNGLQNGKEYQERRTHWPKLLERHGYGLDGRASHRLWNWLSLQGVFKES